jgi:DNA-binding SARP family transcriptional activator
LHAWPHASGRRFRYETCRHELAQEMDVEPSAETTQLYEQIRSDVLSEVTLREAVTPYPPVQAA